MATAAAIRPDAKARSLELAQAHGETVCSWHARAIGMTLDSAGDLVNAAWRVASATSAVEYVTTYAAATDRVECDCRAAQYHRPCWHAGLALMKGRYLAKLYAAAGRAEAAAIASRDATHENNARAMGY